MTSRRPHFLIVTYPVQSHINPGLHLAHRLISAAGATVTFSTSASAHRLMFPGATSPVHRGDLTFIPYPGGEPNRRDFEAAQSQAASGLDSIIADLAARDQHVTCVIHTLLLTWASDVARQRGIPSVQFWIQPATVFAAYYHYFHGYEDVIKSHVDDPRFAVKLPGLPPIEIRDLPSFVTTDSLGGPYSVILPRFRQCFEKMDETKCMVLVNSFDELEPEGLLTDVKLELIAVGPILPKIDSKVVEFDLFKPDEKGYMDWLDRKMEKSVVYVSFGSISVLKKQQMEEILKGLKMSGRPYLWVVRKECRYEDLEFDDDEEHGIVVEWCSQMQVLRHPSVGCFVTHCGWNSTMESLICGVPIVGVPQWSDQMTNAMLVEKRWGCGVRTDVNEEGELEGEELKRCLDLVMGEWEKGKEIRRSAEFWKKKAREVVSEGGSSDRNLKAFVETIANYGQHCC